MWRGITKQDIDLAEYLRGNYALRPRKVSARGQVDVADLGNRRYTSIVDLDVVRSLQAGRGIHKRASSTSVTPVTCAPTT